ncbi:MAG: hypothetical protein JRJ73_09485 [Deltaproteobacteria bacterium]|nr:hypothetical protein [Deltaproteobacteria bacterium]
MDGEAGLEPPAGSRTPATHFMADGGTQPIRTKQVSKTMVTNFLGKIETSTLELCSIRRGFLVTTSPAMPLALLKGVEPDRRVW